MSADMRGTATSNNASACVPHQTNVRLDDHDNCASTLYQSASSPLTLPLIPFTYQRTAFVSVNSAQAATSIDLRRTFWVGPVLRDFT